MSQVSTLAPDNLLNPLSLAELGEHHVNRFQRLGALDDSEKAIEYLSRALTLATDGDPIVPLLFINLGACYSSRFQRLGELSDLEKAMECESRALDLTPDGHPTLPPLLINLGVSYGSRFQRLGELVDLEKAIECESRALASIPNNHPSLPTLLTNLGASHTNRFERLGDPNDLKKAIEHQTRALVLFPNDHPGLPGLLSNLGASHGARFQRLGEPDDIAKAAEYMSIAISLTPDDHPHLPSLLINLSLVQKEQFKRLGNPEDLEKAIEYESRAISMTPSDHPSLPHMLTSLGVSYSDRFRRQGKLNDLEQAIGCKSRARALTPEDHPGLPPLLIELGLSYRDRFQLLGELGDLEKAMECSSYAVKLTPDDHPGMPFRLVNLGASHSVRFQRLGDPKDIEKAVEYMSIARSLIPEGHPKLPSLLINLGASHINRFHSLGELGDLDRAIECNSSALALTPPGHPDLPSWLINLGVSYGSRFQRLGELSDLEKAIECQCSALALSPDGHPNLSKLHRNLGNYRFLLSQCTGELSQLQDSLHSFRNASQSSTGAPNEKFGAALEWSTLASKNSSLNCIEAYQTAIDLLPQYIWLGTTTRQRYHDLDKAKNLAVSAASAAIVSSEYGLALEWLEHARCVVWNQSLMLRSPLDQLQSSHPALAARLRTIADQLHQAGTEPQASQDLSSDLASSEQAAQKHHGLAKEYEDILSEARNLPGFEDFLRPIKVHDLARAARNGPVVVLNCDVNSCDALFILPGRDEVTHLPLPNFTGEKAWRRWSEIRASLSRKGIRERGFKVLGDPNDKDKFESALAALWNDVVKPILDYLGYTSRITGENLPHITWCPTGALSFLPLHAAGDYSKPGSRVFDYVISSYTPTLTSLLTSKPTVLDSHCRVLAISQSNTPGHSPLPGTTEELECLESHTLHKAQYSQLVGGQATTTAVLDAMEQHDWVHLACHAHQSVGDPTQSGFFLQDGTLDLAAINRRSFKNKGLAFLSACQTAAGDERLPDEAIHLASGMLMAGYTSVIATMWSVQDEDAPFVADKVYAELMRGGKLGDGEAGKALHNAVAELRSKVGEKEFSRWVPYIHLGS